MNMKPKSEVESSGANCTFINLSSCLPFIHPSSILYRGRKEGRKEGRKPFVSSFLPSSQSLTPSLFPSSFLCFFLFLLSFLPSLPPSLNPSYLTSDIFFSLFYSLCVAFFLCVFASIVFIYYSINELIIPTVVGGTGWACKGSNEVIAVSWIGFTP